MAQGDTHHSCYCVRPNPDDLSRNQYQKVYYTVHADGNGTVISRGDWENNAPSTTDGQCAAWICS